jgi:DNA-binding GntR family transcriptional regulator
MEITESQPIGLGVEALPPMVPMDQKTYRYLKNMIFEYKLVPGQKLQAQDLADRIGVSRTPVKNALNLLEREGFVRLIPYKGFYMVELSRQEALELFEVRAALETLAVRKAIERFNDEAFAELTRRKEAYEAAVEKQLTRGRFLLDRDFHLQIAVMSKNETLVKQLKQVKELSFLKHRMEGLSQQRGFSVWREHEDIWLAIRERDVEKGVKAVEFHIRKHRDNILSVLTE